MTSIKKIKTSLVNQGRKESSDGSSTICGINQELESTEKENLSELDVVTVPVNAENSIKKMLLELKVCENLLKMISPRPFLWYNLNITINSSIASSVDLLRMTGRRRGDRADRPVTDGCKIAVPAKFQGRGGSNETTIAAYPVGMPGSGPCMQPGCTCDGGHGTGDRRGAG